MSSHFLRAYFFSDSKDANYQLNTFLGSVPRQHPQSELHHCVLYLAPGDYHRIHAPTEFKIEERTHHSGELLPVAPAFVKSCPSTFSLNERVNLNGTWKYGFFSMSPVGAYNVGSITLTSEPDLVTNIPSVGHHVSRRSFRTPIEVQRGDEVACFELGSTVVLVFEVPKGYKWEWNVKTDARVKVGQPLGRIVPE